MELVIQYSDAFERVKQCALRGDTEGLKAAACCLPGKQQLRDVMGVFGYDDQGFADFYGFVGAIEGAADAVRLMDWRANRETGLQWEWLYNLLMSLMRFMLTN